MTMFRAGRPRRRDRACAPEEWRQENRGFRRVQRAERALLIRGGEARRQKKPILVAQRDLETLGETTRGSAAPCRSRQERCRVGSRRHRRGRSGSSGAARASGAAARRKEADGRSWRSSLAPGGAQGHDLRGQATSARAVASSCQVIDSQPATARCWRQREGSEALDLRSGERRCSTLRRSPTVMSPRGTNRTRPGAHPPLPPLWAKISTLGHSGGRGYAPLTRLTVAAPAKNAAREGIRFRAAPTARLRGDVVTFRWEMLLADSETVLASGLEFLIVDDDGRVVIRHPFAPA